MCSGKLACGPFIRLATGYTPFRNYVTSLSLVSWLYTLLVDSNAVTWVLLLLTLLVLFFVRNSLRVYLVRAAVVWGWTASSH